MKRFHAFFGALALLCATAPALAQTQLQFGLKAGANPREVCVFDLSGSCISIGRVDATGHAVTWLGATMPGLTGDVTSASGSSATTIAALAVTTGKLGALAVTTAKIADAQVTAAKLAAGAAVGNIGYTPAPTASPTFTGNVALSGTLQGVDVTAARLGKLLETVEIEEFGGAADNGVTDNYLPFQNAATAALSTCRPLRLRAGTYRFSHALTVNYSGAGANCSASGVNLLAPDITGSGISTTFLAFENAATSGIEIDGGSDAYGAKMGGFTIIKGGYPGNRYGDGTGNGFVINSAFHFHLENVRTMQWEYGMNLVDAQEFVGVNVSSEYNYFGLVSQGGAFTAPNGITFINSRFGNNFTNGCDFINPSAVNFIGGSIESNNPKQHTVDPTKQWGCRIILHPSSFTIQGTVAATFQGVYIENNAGAADILYSNYGLPSIVNLIGNTFQRHGRQLTAPYSDYTPYNIQISQSGGVQNVVNLIGNGFQGFLGSPGYLPDYIYSSSRPNVYVTDPTQPLKLLDQGNLYVSTGNVEVPVFARPLGVTAGTCGGPTSVASYGTQFYGMVKIGVDGPHSTCQITLPVFSGSPLCTVSAANGYLISYAVAASGSQWTLTATKSAGNFAANDELNYTCANR